MQSVLLNISLYVRYALCSALGRYLCFEVRATGRLLMGHLLQPTFRQNHGCSDTVRKKLPAAYLQRDLAPNLHWDIVQPREHLLQWVSNSDLTHHLQLMLFPRSPGRVTAQQRQIMVSSSSVGRDSLLYLLSPCNISYGCKWIKYPMHNRES